MAPSFTFVLFTEQGMGSVEKCNYMKDRKSKGI